MSNEYDCEYLFRIVHLGDSQEFLENLEGNSALNINIQNEAGESLLIHCVKRLEAKWTAVFGGEFRTICKMLIDRNIDVNLRDASGKTAANYAAEYQQLEVLRLLVQKGAHLDRNVLDSVIDKEDWILALCASLAKESGLEHESEDTSGQVNRGEQVKLQLFHHLLASSYLSSINWMCELFPEIIEKKNEESLTALHIAVIENNLDALKVLLRFNANLEAVDGKGHTALHFAVDNGNMECIRSLLDSGSHINCQDVSGATPLHYAINAGSEDDDSSDTGPKLLQYLLEHGADTTFADTYGRLALHWAANAGNAKVCAMMVQHESPVNARCNDGHTALHIAASQGHAECIRVLVMKCGADIDIKDKYGYTPLFNAISKRHVHCAELLLYEDASPNHSDNTQGISPAHLAASKGFTEALEVLFKYQGSLELRNNDGDLPIHEAALFKNRDAVKYMIRCQCKVNVRNDKGFTPLHLAASAGAIDVCECLLAGGADENSINVQCRNGIYKYITPLDLAQLNRHSQCARYLQANSGFRGNEIVKFAARKIQRWWRSHREPRIVLEPIQEYDDDCLEETNTESAVEDGRNCLTKAQHTAEKNENFHEQKHDSERQKKKTISKEKRPSTSSIGNNPIKANKTEINTKETSMQKNKPTTSSSNGKNNAQTLLKRSQKMPEESHRPKLKISPGKKTALPSEKHVRSFKSPTRESPSNQQKNTTTKELRPAVKPKSPRYNRIPSPTKTAKVEERKDLQERSKGGTLKQEKACEMQQNSDDANLSSISQKLPEEREDLQDRSGEAISKQTKACTLNQTENDANPSDQIQERGDIQSDLNVNSSKLEAPPTNEHDLRRLLDVEILRKQNLGKEIARLKKNLEERSQKIEKKLGVIEKKMGKL